MKIRKLARWSGILGIIFVYANSVADIFNKLPQHTLPEPTPWVDKHKWAGLSDSVSIQPEFRDAWKSQSRISIEQLECVAIDEHTLEIRGAISECQYNVYEWQERTTYRFHLARDGSHAATWMPPYGVKEYQNQQTVWKNCMPDVIRVSTTDITDWPEANIVVQPDGTFHGSVKVNEKWFVKEPLPNNRYFSLYRYDNPIKLYLSPSYTAEHVMFEPQTAAIQIWFRKIDEQAVREYVANTEPLVRLQTVDELSHTPVGVKFKITGISVPSKVDVSKKLEDEFKDPEVLNLVASTYLSDFLGGGEVIEKEGIYDTAFRGVAGAKYKIETFNENYLYHEEELELPAQKLINKEILLKEKPH